MLVATPIGITIDYFLFTLKNPNEFSVNSGFGKITIFNPTTNLFTKNNIYQNDELGFQVSKPNDNWKIRPASDTFDEEKLNSLRSIGYQDGIFLDINENRRFLITVFKVKQEDFNLSQYVEEQIQQMNLQREVNVSIKQISPTNNWAIFAMDLGSNTDHSHGEQILFFKNNKLYMLQYSGNSPNNLSQAEKSEINFIMDSFEVI